MKQIPKPKLTTNREYTTFGQKVASEQQIFCTSTTCADLMQKGKK